MSFKQINNRITAVIKAAVAMQDRIQAVAIESLEHAEAHGDVTLIKRLCTELPAGQRAKALTVWVGKYFPITAKNGEWKLRGKAENRVWNYEDALADPYWRPDEATMFKQDLSKFDFDQLVHAMLASKLNQLEKSKEKSFNGEYDESIEDIDATIAQLKDQASRAGYLNDAPPTPH